jgi:hypothetical protein
MYPIVTHQEMEYIAHAIGAFLESKYPKATPVDTLPAGGDGDDYGACASWGGSSFFVDIDQAIIYLKGLIDHKWPHAHDGLFTKIGVFDDPTSMRKRPGTKAIYFWTTMVKEVVADVVVSRPDPDCPECKGTGKYFGLNKIVECRTCQS